MNETELDDRPQKAAAKARSKPKSPPSKIEDGAPGAYEMARGYMKSEGRAPSVPPRLEPMEVKKPEGLEELARTLRSCAGMPRVRPRRLVSTP